MRSYDNKSPFLTPTRANRGLDKDGVFRLPIVFKNPSAVEMVQKAIDREAVLEPIPNHENGPHYNLTVSLVIGVVIFMCMATGLALGYMGGWR